jgi:hypothetical protein
MVGVPPLRPRKENTYYSQKILYNVTLIIKMKSYSFLSIFLEEGIQSG